ncbi:MAG: hypothetical protein WC654_08150 [Patescibacteria group bacterium]
MKSQVRTHRLSSLWKLVTFAYSRKNAARSLKYANDLIYLEKKHLPYGGDLCGNELPLLSPYKYSTFEKARLRTISYLGGFLMLYAPADADEMARRVRRKKIEQRPLNLVAAHNKLGG